MFAEIFLVYYKFSYPEYSFYFLRKMKMSIGENEKSIRHAFFNKKFTMKYKFLTPKKCIL